MSTFVLRIVGSGYQMVVEQFRGPSIHGMPGLVVPRRSAGSRGLDVLLEYNGSPELGFDFKTGRGWSPAFKQEIELRFGVPVEEVRPR